jgi:hypothetical protein
MLSGRITFGLGQVETFPGPPPMLPPFGQTAVAQTPPVQWGLPEWAIVFTLGYIVISVLFTSKKAVGGVYGFYRQRRAKRAAYHEREAEHFRR